MLTEYSIKVAGDTGEFLVTKHEDGTPTVTYIVGAKGMNCSCPGSTHHKVQCKHLKIIKAFKAMGRPRGGLFNITRARGVQYAPTEESVR